MAIFNDPEQLQRAIELKVKNAMTIVAQVMREVLQDNIQEFFYDEYEPNSYVRTYDLLERAPIALKAEFVGDSIVCGVYLDANQLRKINGKHAIDGEKIINLASEGYHGIEEEKYQTNGRFIEETINELFTNQKLLKTLAELLSEQGLNVHF